MVTGRSHRLVWLAAGVLIAVVLVFAAIRLVIDVPYLVSGTTPDESLFEYRYVAQAGSAYAHILPGVAYLLLVPIQLWRRFRNRHLRWHRRIGRVALVSGVVSGIFAIVFGARHAFGGAVEAAAAVVFSVWFLTALVIAYRAVRRHDIRMHRRWMIRAFAIGVAVGTIRLWIGFFQAVGLLEFRDAFGVAFWLSFSLHVAAAEAYLRWRPEVSGFARPRA